MFSTDAVCEIHGVPVLTPAATWVSLAAVLPLHDLIAVTDRLISGTRDIAAVSSRAELATHMDGIGGRRGVRNLRAALNDARERVWSRPETLVRLTLVRVGLPEPVPNFETMVDGRTAILDLAWPEWKVAAEYDGRWHDQSPAQWAADAHRRERLAAAGWSVGHTRADDFFPSPAEIVGATFRRLAERGAPVPSIIETTNLPRFER